jgi:SPP1 gp7 family putative phage head morphogenesis protein
MATVGISLNDIDRGQISNAVNATLVEGSKVSAWWKAQERSLVTTVTRTVRAGLNNGLTSQQIASNLRSNAFKGTKSQAQTLVSTSINAVSNKTRVESFEENKDVIKGYQQVSTLDSRTSDICIAYSGMAWDFDGNPLPGTNTTLPFNGGPPRHFNCRSTLIPVLKDFEELGFSTKAKIPPGTRASMDGQIAADISFNDFLRGKSKTFQDKLLGPARAKLWRGNRITLNQLVDMRGNPLSVDELKALSVKKRLEVREKARIQPPPEQVKKAEPKAFQKEGIDKDLQVAINETFDPVKDTQVRDLVEKAPPPAALTGEVKGDRGSKAAGAWYNASSWQLNMFGKGKRHDDWWEGVFAHEYGHHLDNVVGRSLRPELLRTKGQDYASMNWSKIRDGESRKLPTKNQSRRGSFSEANDKATVALVKDNDLMDAKGNVKKDGLRKAYAKEGLDMDALEAEMDIWYEAGSLTDNNRNVILLRTLAAVKAKDPSAIINATLSAGTRTGIGSRVWVNFADFFGSMTKERIGWGHGKAYYKGVWGERSQGAEMFANYFSLQARMPALASIIRKFAPKWTAQWHLDVDDFIKTGDIPVQGGL